MRTSCAIPADVPRRARCRPSARHHDSASTTGTHRFRRPLQGPQIDELRAHRRFRDPPPRRPVRLSTGGGRRRRRAGHHHVVRGADLLGQHAAADRLAAGIGTAHSRYCTCAGSHRCRTDANSPNRRRSLQSTRPAGRAACGGRCISAGRARRRNCVRGPPATVCWNGQSRTGSRSRSPACAEIGVSMSAIDTATGVLR